MMDTALATIEDDKPAIDLTGKQEQFCNEYLVDFNGTQAAIRAKYSEHTAYSIAWENLRKPEIAARIEELKAEQLEMLGVTPFSILRSLACIANGDLRNLFTADGNLVDPKDWDDATAMAVQSVDTVTAAKGGGHVEYTRKIKMYDRQRALELLGKHANLFVEKIEHSGQIDTKWLVEYKNAEPSTP